MGDKLIMFPSGSQVVVQIDGDHNNPVKIFFTGVTLIINGIPIGDPDDCKIIYSQSGHEISFSCPDHRHVIATVQKGVL